MDICQTSWTSRHKRAFRGVLGGHKSKILGRLSNDWTDWHQIWYTSADSSGNGHRLNTIRPSTLGGGGGLGGHKFKSQGKMSNGWSDWHQIWYTCADSSGNGYTPNKLPLETQGHLGGFRGSTIRKYWEAVRLAPTLVHVCGFIWEWAYAKYKSPLNTPGGIGGGGGLGWHKFIKSGEAVKRLDRLAPTLAHICRSIWEWRYVKQIAPRDTRGHLGEGLGVKQSKI